MEAAAKAFFATPRFAVAGASSDSAKFGHKIFVWYLQHSLPAVPMNPRVPNITAPPSSSSYPCISTPSALPDPCSTALSIITPPPITIRLLKEAKEAGVPAVWLQPGSFDAEGLKFAKEAFPGKAVGGGDGEGEEGTLGHEGWCVLVDGERALKDAGREWKRVKL